MLSRLSTRALRSRSSSLRPIIAKKALSTHPVRGQIAFSYSIPPGTDLPHSKLFESIQEKKVIANPTSHDAVVLLATPDFAQALEDEPFMSRFVRTICPSSSSSGAGQFHVLSAVVDHVAPPAGSYTPIRGFSVLRGHLDDMLPRLWAPSPPPSREDADAVSALTFTLGSPSVTLPLARTAFLNHRESTLLTSRFDFSGGGAPRLAQRSEKRSQQVFWSPNRELRVLADLGLFAPLIPLTRPRPVTESFGNIIKGIEVDGVPVPASTELEWAVNSLHRNGTLPGSLGVWAVVTSNDSEAPDLDAWLENGPGPILDLSDPDDIKDLTRATATQLSKLYNHGGCFYKILSGGGGWGAKRGLLSLDPQRTHFSLSEEEEMARFMNTMRHSGFAPRGSRIQFFMSSPALPETNRPLVPGISFGVAGDTPYPEDPAIIEGFIGGHFGALSNDAVFLSGPGSPNGEETKLSVHHSCVFVPDEDKSGASDGVFWTLLPDAGTMGLFGWLKPFA